MKHRTSYLEGFIQALSHSRKDGSCAVNEDISFVFNIPQKGASMVVMSTSRYGDVLYGYLDYGDRYEYCVMPSRTAELYIIHSTEPIRIWKEYSLTFCDYKSNNRKRR